MKKLTLKPATCALLSAALLTFVSCNSDKAPEPMAEQTSSVKTEKGVPGGTVVETYTMTANVVKVDGDKREVVLATADGNEQTVKCGPQIVNFDQIQVGDQLKVNVVEELAVSMSTESGRSESGGAALVSLAPKGAKPGGMMAETVEVTATVTAIDLGLHKATLRFPDGTIRTIAVRKDVDLTQRSIGEKVVIRKTVAIALSVEKPQTKE